MIDLLFVLVSICLIHDICFLLYYIIFECTNITRTIFVMPISDNKKDRPSPHKFTNVNVYY